MTDARDADFIARLQEVVTGEVRAAAPLRRYSTYRIGGPATVLHPAHSDDVGAALQWAKSAGVPVFPLGLGSNVLLPDEGLSALVIRIGKGLDAIVAEGSRWRLGAGLPAPIAARRSAAAGHAGLQMMVGVPGTVGGGVYMNAGCHGGEWKDVVSRVTVAVPPEGEVRVLTRSEIPFRYRSSGLGDQIVLEAEVDLAPGNPAELEAEVQRLFAWRESSTPFNQPCCGSVFRNPTWPEGPPAPTLRTAGQLIEAVGLKGTRVGGVEVSPMHANYFVNVEGGTAADVKALMAMARTRVEERFGVRLEPEVKVITGGAAT